MSGARRSSRRTTAAAPPVEEREVIELPDDAPSIPPAIPLTPQSSSSGRKRRRDSSTAATHDIPPTSPPALPADTHNTAVAQTAVGRGRGRKSTANKAATDTSKATAADDAIKQQLLDNPNQPLSLSQACTVYQLHIPPCAPLTPPQQQSQAVKACKPAGHPNCLHTLGYRRKGVWSTNPPHLTLLGSDPAASHRSADWYVGMKNMGATCYLNILVQSLYMKRTLSRQYDAIRQLP